VFRNRQLVGEKLGILANRLPSGVAAPNITPLTSSASSTLGIGLTAKDRTLMDVYDLAQFVVRPHLLSASGVADVNVFGGKVRQWQVQFEPDTLIRAGVGVNDLVEAVRRSSGLRPGGTVETRNQRILVTSEGQPASAAELAQAVLSVRNGQVLRLADVATVVEAPAPSISAATINGTPGVFLMVQGQLGANTYATTLAVESRLDQLRPLLQREGLTVHTQLFRPASFIETSIGNVQRDILIGSALVVPEASWPETAISPPMAEPSAGLLRRPRAWGTRRKASTGSSVPAVPAQRSSATGTLWRASRAEADSVRSPARRAMT
jgi:Cu/Ag efflux pump CusA